MAVWRVKYQVKGHKKVHIFSITGAAAAEKLEGILF